MKDIGDNTVYRIDWQEVTPVVLLPRALRMTFSTRIFLWAFLGIALTICFASFFSFGKTVHDDNTPVSLFSLMSTDSWFCSEGTPEDWLKIPDSTQNTHLGISPGENLYSAHPWSYYTMPGYILYTTDVGGWNVFFANAIWFLVILLIWSGFGGVITRIAAVRFARNQREGVKLVSAFLKDKYLSYLGAVLLPMSGIAICLVPLWIESWFVSIHLTWLAVIWLPVAIVFGCLAFLMAIGLVLGWPLMFAAISAEGSDAFDAIGRAYSYIYQRPIQFFFYQGANFLIFSVVGYLFLYAIGLLLTMIQTHGSLTDFQDYDSVLDAVAAKQYAIGLILAFLWLVEMVAVLFPFVYFWVSSTVIYFLMRRSCDATPFDQVYRIGPAAIKRNVAPIVKKEDGTVEVQSNGTDQS